MSLRFIVICTVFALGLFLPYSLQAAEDGWKKEFSAICSEVVNARELEDGELLRLALESDKLLKRLRNMQEREVKIYVFRLEKCKKFFEFTLESNKRRKG